MPSFWYGSTGESNPGVQMRGGCSMTLQQTGAKTSKHKQEY